MSRNLPATRTLRRLLQWRVVLSLLFCLTLALAPSLAEARAGGSSGGKSSSSSMGSRGSRTIENNGAAPVTRSMNPATNPSAGSATRAAAPAAGGSFFQRNPMLTGLAGGFLGAMLFGSLFGGALGGMSGALGGMLQFLIIGLLIFLAVRLFMRWRAGANGAPAGGVPLPQPVGAAVSPGAAPRYRGVDTTVNDSDLEAFQGIHGEVQEAWSKADLGRLRQLMTPEMLSYFSEELTNNASQGVQNVVSNVQLLKGDISESWDEGDLQYATAYMQWSAIDYVTRIGRSPGMPDYVAGGDPNRPIESEEVWTFVRRRGGNWLLSAIQQV